jgi:hypothetical protein
MFARSSRNGESVSTVIRLIRSGSNGRGALGADVRATSRASTSSSLDRRISGCRGGPVRSSFAGTPGEHAFRPFRTCPTHHNDDSPPSLTSSPSLLSDRSTRLADTIRRLVATPVSDGVAGLGYSDDHTDADFQSIMKRQDRASPTMARTRPRRHCSPSFRSGSLRSGIVGVATQRNATVASPHAHWAITSLHGFHVESPGTRSFFARQDRGTQYAS